MMATSAAPESPVLQRLTSPSREGGLEGTTIPEMVDNGIRLRAERVILREKVLGLWRSLTWRELGFRMRSIGMGLAAQGVVPGDRCCILARTSQDWVLADLGVLGAGGVSAGIYPTDAPNQVRYVLQDSESVVVFVENEEQLDKVLEVRQYCPRLRRIVVFDMKGLRGFSDPMVISLEDLELQGDEHDRKAGADWARRMRSRRPDDLALLVYTSGTTGPPKGAMLTHRNVVFQCRNCLSLLPLREGEARLAFLPLCHVAERVVGLYLSLCGGVISNFVEGPDTVPENLREVRPHVFFAVPRVWEKLYSSVRLSVDEATPFQRWAYFKALEVGERMSGRRLDRRAVSPRLSLAHLAADRLVLRKIRRLLGLERCRWLLSGAAPISPALIRWYLALGLPFLEGYGLTESTAVASVTPPDAIRPGKVGKPIPFGELRIGPNGEILLRGDHVFAGYLNRPRETEQALREGWLHSGDVGVLDEEGFLRITDRLKDILITAGGKNISPSEIENELKFSPYVSDAVVLGEGKKYLTCLILIDEETVSRYAQDRLIPFTDFSSLCRAPEVVKLIEREVAEVNRKFARVEQIKRFRLIEKRLTPEDEELTPTMKLKRKLVYSNFLDLIESMYRED